MNVKIPNMCKAKAIGIMLIVLMSAGIAQASLLDDFRDKARELLLSITGSYGGANQLTSTACTAPYPAGGYTQFDIWYNDGGWRLIKYGAYSYSCPESGSQSWFTSNRDLALKFNIPYGTNPDTANFIPADTPAPTYNQPQPTVNQPLPTIEQPRYTPPPEIIPEPIATVIGIEQSPGFDSGLAILGLLITALLVLRRR